MDGTGAPGFQGDVGIRGGKIAKVGAIGKDEGTAELDARERVVCPGFIDLHTHSDIPLVMDGTAESAVRMGSTLHVIGEHWTVGPLAGVGLDHFKTLVKNRYGFTDVDWTSVAGYFDRVQRSGVSINVASGIGVQQIG